MLMEDGFIEDQKTAEEYEKESYTLTCQKIPRQSPRA